MDELPTSVRKAWGRLAEELPALRDLSKLTVEPKTYPVTVIESVEVFIEDRQVMVPEAPEVTTADLASFTRWSDDPARQLDLWGMVGAVEAGSRHTETCPDCGGSRRVACRRCGGSGRLVCPFCGGTGRRHCGHCGGSGSVEHRDGDQVHRRSCSSCGGSGHSWCGHCSGDGRVRCSTCRGSGEVECETCCPRGTVDYYTQRVYQERTVHQRVLPISIDGLGEPIALPITHLDRGNRAEPVPQDAGKGPTRLFFTRPSTAEVFTVRESPVGELYATLVASKEERPYTISHRMPLDPDWSSDRQRWAYLLALVEYVAAVALVTLFFANLCRPHSWVLLAGAAVVAYLAFRVDRNPLRAARLALTGSRCGVHGEIYTTYCAHCGQALCPICFNISLRCPKCGECYTRHADEYIWDGQRHACRPPAD